MPASHLFVLSSSATAEVEPIAPEKVVEGAPVAATKHQYAFEERIFVGEWSCSAGAWRVSYTEWEFCEVLRGVCELTPDGGTPQRFEAGEAFVIEPGFVGIFRVVAPMTKRYVIRVEA